MILPWPVVFDIYEAKALLLALLCLWVTDTIGLAYRKNSVKVTKLEFPDVLNIFCQKWIWKSKNKEKRENIKTINKN